MRSAKPGTLEWAKERHAAGLRVEHYNHRWDAWFETEPEGQLEDWTMDGIEAQWRERPLYTPAEEQIKAAEASKLKNVILGVVSRIVSPRN
jgi:hypothetical protein